MHNNKLCKGVTNIQDCLLLQEDFNHASHCVDFWQMELNPEKSKFFQLVIAKYTLTIHFKVDLLRT